MASPKLRRAELAEASRPICSIGSASSRRPTRKTSTRWRRSSGRVRVYVPANARFSTGTGALITAVQVDRIGNDARSDKTKTPWSQLVRDNQQCATSAGETTRGIRFCGVIGASTTSSLASTSTSAQKKARCAHSSSSLAAEHCDVQASPLLEALIMTLLRRNGLKSMTATPTALSGP